MATNTACKFGDRCKHKGKTCGYDHPDGTKGVCKHGDECRGKGKTCWFNHPDGTKGVPRQVIDRKDTPDGEKQVNKSSGLKLIDLYKIFPKCSHFDGREGSCDLGENCMKLHFMAEGKKLCYSHCLRGICKKMSHSQAEHPSDFDLFSFADWKLLEIFEQSMINKDGRKETQRIAEWRDDAVSD